MIAVIKDTLYFAAVFGAILVAPKVAILFKMKNQDISTAISALIFTAILFILFFLLRVGHVEDFHVQPLRQLKCMQGPYMLNEEDRKYCNTVPPSELCQYGCSNPFMGRPYPKFEYTPLSDGNWSNQTCKNWM